VESTKQRKIARPGGLAFVDHGGYRAGMLKPGDEAPDFVVADGTRTLHRILEDRSAVVFFFPKAFTPG